MQTFAGCALALGWIIGAVGQAQASPLLFTGLGHPYGVYDSRATAVSADGSTVVGVITPIPGSPQPQQGFRWTRVSGLSGLGTLGAGGSSEAYAVSADGSVVVGSATFGSDSLAFGWANTVGMIALSPPGRFSSAADLSDDGGVIVGSCFFAAVFQDGTCKSLGAGDQAHAVSGDGSIIVGTTYVFGVGYTAWRRVGTLFLDLGDLPGGDLSTSPDDISFDGSVIVGSAQSTFGTEAFRWTSSTGLVGLGDLSGGDFFSRAHAVSADGSVVLGSGTSTSGPEPFLWDQTNGMRELARVLEGLGIDLGGWVLDQATGISADGRTLVGYGLNERGLREAWLAQIPETSTVSLLAPSLAALAIARRRLR